MLDWNSSPHNIDRAWGQGFPHLHSILRKPNRFESIRNTISILDLFFLWDSDCVEHFVLASDSVHAIAPTKKKGKDGNCVTLSHFPWKHTSYPPPTVSHIDTRNKLPVGGGTLEVVSSGS